MDTRIHERFNDHILRQIAQRFGLEFEDLHAIGGFENYIFGYTKEGKEQILRISHEIHRTINRTKGELHWVSYLGEHGASVSHPIPSPQGNMVEVVDDGQGSYFMAVSFEKAKGRKVIAEDLTPQFYETYGKTLGQLHKLTLDYKVMDPHLKPHRWDEDVLVRRYDELLPKEELLIRTKYEELLDYLNQLPKNHESYGVIHGDIHIGNMFNDQGKLTIFDFDDYCENWFISDLAIAFFYAVEYSKKSGQALEDFATMVFKNLIKGYLQEYKLDPFWIQQMPYFLKMREFTLYIVIYESYTKETLDAWATRYLEKHKPRLEQGLPFTRINLLEIYENMLK